jgi:hypothetical protein
MHTGAAGSVAFFFGMARLHLISVASSFFAKKLPAFHGNVPLCGVFSHSVSTYATFFLRTEHLLAITAI